ncbi:MAG: hypothetical protein ACXQT4_04745 [Methanotrichaceae archaeon]
MRTERRTKLDGKELWRLWLDQFDDELVALAEAVWAANKMAKDKPPQTRDKFYALKDEFILRYATTGKKVRDELPPSTYKGTCGEIRTLYRHNVMAGERVYRLHSYIMPLENETELVEDEEQHDKYSVDEWSWLSFSFFELYTMLSYYAATYWDFSAERITTKSAGSPRL